jgi:hypothetical protein
LDKMELLWMFLGVVENERRLYRNLLEE